MNDFFKGVFDKAAREIVLPEIDGERCVYALLDSATCSRCVDACPHGAWTLDDESLDIDTALCDGCGLCAPVCPQGAIGHAFAAHRRQWRDRALAFCACEKASLDAEQDVAVVPCLHSLGIRDLLELYNEGFVHLLVTAGDCETCVRGAAARLEARVASVNQLLASRGMKPINLRYLAARKWQSMFSMTDERADFGMRLGRRGFLRHVLSAGVEQGAKAAGLENEGRAVFVPPGALLPAVSDQDIDLYVPVMLEDRCSGCDACVRICPTDAVVLEEDDREAKYRISSARCTGCGICCDVCSADAIRIESQAVQIHEIIELDEMVCQSCGVPFHVPASRNMTDECCPICEQTTRYQDHYQFKE